MIYIKNEYLFSKRFVVEKYLRFDIIETVRQGNFAEIFERGLTGKMRNEIILTGQDRTGQDRTGQDRTGQDRTGQDRTGYKYNLISVLKLKYVKFGHLF